MEVDDPLIVQMQLPTIRETFAANGFPLGKRIRGTSWRLRTPGWKYTLSYSQAGWSLEPSNTSLNYDRLLNLLTLAIQEANRVPTD